MIGIILAMMFLNFKSFIPVQYAISNLNAYWNYINGNAIVVFYDSDGLGSFYRKGLGREYVTLIGRNPYNEISGRLLKNKILVKGEFQDDMSKFYNKKIFKVSDWDIVFPIIREYSFSDYQKSRLIGPIFYIDQFDIETGDMYEYSNATKSISKIEAEYLAYLNNTDYFIITSKIEEDKILWHSIDYTLSNNHDLEEKINEDIIQLIGNDLPENTLNRNIIFNGSIQKYINKFFICGYRRGDIIYVREWKIISPFENCQTGIKYFLGEEDFINNED